MLEGCGGGDGNSATSATTMMVQAAVNRSEIGGSGLNVLSAYQSSAFGTANAVAVPISAQGAQAQMITDANGKVRAAAISAVSLPSGQSALTFDAASTATALVFMTPGILTIDPAEAKTRLTQIKSLASITPLTAYLAQNLPTSSVNDLRSQATLDTLLTTCITDWFTQNKNGKAVTHGKSRSASATGITATWGDAPNYPVKITNIAYRFDSVVQQNLAADGVTETAAPVLLKFHGSLPAKASGVLDGPSLFSWGNLLDLESVISAKDSLDVGISTETTTAVVRLWFYGPGLPLSTDTPADVDTLYYKSAAWGQSIIYYLLFPVLDAILGTRDLLGKGVDFAEKFFGSTLGQVESAVNFVSVVNAAQNGSTKAIKSAVVDLLFALVSASLPILELAGVTFAGSETAGVVLAASAVFVASANISRTVTTWLLSTDSSYYDLAVSSAGVTVQ